LGGSNPMPEPGDSSWRCEVCRKPFSSRRAMERCMKRHAEQQEDLRRFHQVQKDLKRDDEWIVLMTSTDRLNNAVICVLGVDDKPTSDLTKAKVFKGQDEVSKWEGGRHWRGSWLCTAAPLRGNGVPPLPWEAGKSESKNP
jgi:hypothetical protein